jgi:hypothetical protein
MPDPAESSHFGRWSECAHEVLKQRALRAEQESEAQVPVNEETETAPPEDLAALAAAEPPASSSVQPQPRIPARGIPVGDTLAAQARKLPRKTPELDAAAARGALDEALQNLEFIGSSGRAPSIGDNKPPSQEKQSVGQDVPQQSGAASPPRQAPVPTASPAAPSRSAPRPGDRVMLERQYGSAARHDVSPAPTLNTHSREFEVDCIDDSDYQLPMASAGGAAPASANAHNGSAESVSVNDAPRTTRPFSSSLNTRNFPEEPV